MSKDRHFHLGRFEPPHWLRDMPHAVAQTFLVTREAIRRVFYEEALTTHAAAIAFYCLLSIGPLILVILSAGGMILQESTGLMDRLKESLTILFPVAQDQMLNQLTSFVSRSRVFGIVGILGLFWSGSRVFASLTTSLNQIWRAEGVRPYWRHRLIAISLVPVLLILLFGLMAASAVYGVLVASSSGAYAPSTPTWLMIGKVATYVLPLAISWIVFFLLYWFLPARDIMKRSAFIGSTVAALLWQMLKLGFDIYVRNFALMDTVYGTMAGIVLLMFWFYYSSMTFLVGAVVGAADMDRRMTQTKPGVGN